jgi:hypothetical protein
LTYNSGTGGFVATEQGLWSVAASFDFTPTPGQDGQIYLANSAWGYYPEWQRLAADPFLGNTWTHTFWLQEGDDFQLRHMVYTGTAQLADWIALEIMRISGPFAG